MMKYFQSKFPWVWGLSDIASRRPGILLEVVGKLVPLFSAHDGRIGLEGAGLGFVPWVRIEKLNQRNFNTDQ